MKILLTVLWLGLAAAVRAQTPESLAISGKGAGFTRLSDATGIAFSNFVSEIRSITNRNLLSGSGVAAGDVDGDGLCDLYFCGLDKDNVLYRNLGHWKFRDATAESGVALSGQDSTGAALVDIDGDRDLDLLVTALGRGLRYFKNDGQGIFAEATRESGLASESGSMSMAIADIEGDGDLDIYLVNYRVNSLKDIPDAKFRVEYIDGKPAITHFNGIPATAPDLTNRFVLGGNGQVLELGEADQLYVNEGLGRFKPVSLTGGRFSDESGQRLREPLFDWGLAALFYDFTGDGAPDLYVCNDFFSPDRIWINDGLGNFRAAPPLSLRSISTFSMGVDFADADRDGFVDCFVTDMLGASHKSRQVQVGEKAPFLAPPGLGEHRLQKSQNTLQLNRGDASFSEVGRFAGVEATDWSWGPIFMDVDLDGWEDLLISNGNQYDVQNADVAQRVEQLKAARRLTHQEILAMMKEFPGLASPKLLFRNERCGGFREMGAEWGFSDVAISQGMALADLDNDGDQDVVINNLFQPAGIYRNESTNGRVAVRLQGAGANTRGIGAAIRFLGGPVEQRQEMIAAGRYLSSDDPMRVFAAGKNFTSGKIEVTWREGGKTVVENVQPNRIYVVAQATQTESARTPHAAAETWFEDASKSLNHTHAEEMFDDFSRQPLLPHKLSQLGPGVAWHDFDSDGWDNLVLGSGRGGKLALYRNDQKGGFTNVVEQYLQRPVGRDHASVLGSGPLLFVGSSNWEDGATNGGAIRIYDTQRKAAGEGLLGVEAATGPMALADIDRDGNLDLFLGGRAVAAKYPQPAVSRIYRNDGSRFVPKQTLEGVGLASGAVFSDLDLDGDPDLLIACHWGPVRAFRNDNGAFAEITAELGLAPHTGLWNSVATADLDSDGRPDIIAGNWGLNSYWKATPEHPLKLYYGDFDGNGAVEMIEARYEKDMKKEVPLRTLRSVGPALPWVMEKMRTFEAYGSASVEEIYGDNLKSARVLQVTTLASTVFLNRGGKFEPQILPPYAQFAPAFGICAADFNGDGREDVFLSQNFFATNPEMARNDAGIGLLLQGDGAGKLAPVPGHVIGIKVYGEQRGCAVADYDHDGRIDLVVSQNGAATTLFRNRAAPPGIRVRFSGAGGVGARLQPLKEGAKFPMQEVQSGSGYWSQNSPVKIIPATAERLRFRLPNGKEGEIQIKPGAKEIVIDPAGQPQFR